MLRKMMEAKNKGFDASFIERQYGMFSCLPIGSDEQRLMEDAFHIYMLPNARVNVAAMKSSDAQTLARAFRELTSRRPEVIRERRISQNTSQSVSTHSPV